MLQYEGVATKLLARSKEKVVSHTDDGRVFKILNQVEMNLLLIIQSNSQNNVILKMDSSFVFSLKVSLKKNIYFFI